MSQVGNGRQACGWCRKQRKRRQASSGEREKGSGRGAKGAVVEEDEGFLEMVGVPLAAVRGAKWISVRQHAVEILACPRLTV